MEVVAILCTVLVGVVLFLTMVFLHGLGERDAERREVEILHLLQDITGQVGAKLDRLENYAESGHGLLLELQILTPKGKEAAKNFMNFTTHGGGILPQ